MRLNLLFITTIFYLSGFSAMAMDLPKGYALQENDKGEFYVTNKEDTIMIEPKIISLGYNPNWIVACIQNISIDTEEKRYIFVDLKWGGATDTVNKKNWEYFKTVYPEMENISMQQLSDDTCP